MRAICNSQLMILPRELASDIYLKSTQYFLASLTSDPNLKPAHHFFASLRAILTVLKPTRHFFASLRAILTVLKPTRHFLASLRAIRNSQLIILPREQGERSWTQCSKLSSRAQRAIFNQFIAPLGLCNIRLTCATSSRLTWSIRARSGRSRFSISQMDSSRS